MFNKPPTGTGASPTATPSRKFIDPISGTLMSALDSTVSLMGFDDAVGGKELDQWQRQNPGLNMASSIIGLMVPYGGWYAAAAKVGFRGKTLMGAGNAAAAKLTVNPFAQGVVQNAVIFAPFETARAASRFVAGDDAGDIARGAAFDLALGSVAGGAVNSLAQIGSKTSLLSGNHWLVKEMGYNKETWANTPAQVKLRDFNSWSMRNGNKIDLNSPKWLEMEGFRTRARNRILTERISPNVAKTGIGSINMNVGRVFSNTANAEEGAENIGHLFEDMFAIMPGRQKRNVLADTKGKKAKKAVIATSVRAPTKAGTGFKPFIEGWKKVVGMPLSDGLLQNIQYPRLLTQALPKKKKVGDINLDAIDLGDASERTGKLDKFFQENTTQIGRGFYMTREADDGMYIMAKKSPEDASQWAIWKTDRPGLFAPSQDAAASAFADMYEISVKGINVPDAQAFRPYQLERPLLEGSDSMAVGYNIKANAHPALVASASDGDKGAMRALLGNSAGWVGQLLRENFAPGVMRYADPSARAMRFAQKAALRVNLKKTTDRVLGKIPDNVSFRQAFGDMAKMRNASPLVKTLRDVGKDQNLVDELVKYAYMDTPVSVALEEGATPVVLKALKLMDENADTEIKSYQAIQKYLGHKVSPALKEHLGLSRRWDDWTVPVYEDGRKVSVLSAPTKEGAAKLAKELQAEMQGLGKSVDFDDPFETLVKSNESAFGSITPKMIDTDNWQKQQILIQSFEGTPSSDLQRALSSARRRTFKKRTGIKGFKQDGGIADLLENHYNTLASVSASEASLAHNAVWADHVLELAARNPREAQLLAAETRMMQGGVQLEHRLEKIASDVMAPMLGRNGAQKLANGINSTMFTATLGLANLAYATTNIVSPLMQTMPHLMWLNRAAPESLAPYYRDIPAIVGGKITGTVGMLDQSKLMWVGMTNMKNPDAATRGVLSELLSDGTLDQRMLDSFVGNNSVMGKLANPFGEATTGGQIAETLMKTTNFLADKSETAARLYTVSVASKLGQGWGLSGAELSNFARNMVDNTMYSYKTIDRAAAFQGPFGSMLGLFKTWMSNFIGWQMQYAGNIGHGGGSALALTNVMGASIGGIGGTPVGMFAENLSRITTDKSLSEQLYAHTDQTVSDAIFFGAPSFLGVSLQGNTALPGANVTRDLEMFYNVASWQMATQLSKSVGEGFGRWHATGDAPWEDRGWRNRFIRATQVKTAYRIQASVQGEAIASLSTGYPALKAPTTGDKVAYMAGFNPVDLDREYEAYEVGTRVQDRNRKIRRILALKYIEAESLRGPDRREAMQSYQSDLRAYPQFDHGSIMRSVKGISKNLGLSPTERRVKDKEAIGRANVIRES